VNLPPDPLTVSKWAIKDPENALRCLETPKYLKDTAWRDPVNLASTLFHCEAFIEGAGVNIKALLALIDEAEECFKGFSHLRWQIVFPRITSSRSFARSVRYFSNHLSSFERDFRANLTSARLQREVINDEFNESRLPINSLGKNSHWFFAVKKAHGPKLTFNAVLDRSFKVKPVFGVGEPFYAIKHLVNRNCGQSVLGGIKSLCLPADEVEPAVENELILAFIDEIRHACNED